MLTISRSQQGGVVIFKVDGRVDSDGAHEVEEHLKEAIDNDHYHIIVDLSKTNYLNSAGLRVFAGTLTQCQAHNGDLKLSGPNAKIMRILQIIGFDMFFNIYDTVEDALNDPPNPD